MRVHFACSTSKLDKYKENYLNICKNIKKFGHIISRDWIDEAIKYYEQRKVDVDREEIYTKMVESILTSDVVVVEGTVSSLSVGHQITIALNKNKPVLFLVCQNGDEKAHFSNSFIDGIKSPLLTSSMYTLENLEETMEDFFNKNKNGTTVKFNIVLTKEIDNYLDWASFAHKINKSEHVRKIIQKYMDEDDNRYRKYLAQLKKGGN